MSQDNNTTALAQALKVIATASDTTASSSLISGYGLTEGEQYDPTVMEWMSRLLELRGIPYNYLIPQSEMLPVESLRFFQIDQAWMNALFQGAFSVGRVTDLDKAMDAFNLSTVQSGAEADETGYEGPTLSGFLLRSQLVKSYPTMVYKATDVDGNHLTSIRLEAISANVMFGIVSGDKPIHELYIQEPMEGVHFGVDEPAHADPSKNTRTLRDLTVGNIGTKLGTTVAVPTRTAAPSVIRMDEMATALNTAPPKASASDSFTSAQFALEMVDTTENYSYVQS